MTDNLTCLIKHCEPVSFLNLLNHQCDLVWATPDPQPGKRLWREQLVEQCASLKDNQSLLLEKAAGKILRLSDNAGKDAVEVIRYSHDDTDVREQLSACANQYERSLWLFMHQPDSFRDALDRRELVVLRRSSRTCQGYALPTGCPVSDNPETLEALKNAIADIVQCRSDHVVLTLCERYDGDTVEPDYYELRCHYNRTPERMERVSEGVLEACDLVWAESFYLTYDPSSGYLYVLSRHSEHWPKLAKSVSETLLSEHFSGETLPLRTYDLHRLGSRHFVPDTGLAPEILQAKVTLLVWKQGKKSLTLASAPGDPDTIHTTLATFTSTDVNPSPLLLCKGILTLKLRADEPGERARTLHVTITSSERCSIKCSREKDRVWVNRYLERLGLVRNENADNTITEYCA